MRCVLVGKGGREYALLYGLSKSKVIDELYVCPGSDAMSILAKRIPEGKNVAETAKSIADLKPGLVVIGPEDPLVAGLADQLRSEGIDTVGPSQVFAQLEGSKSFSKQWMLEHGVPTAPAQVASTAHEALTLLSRWDFSRPVVVKADGLAAGKGVVIAKTLPEAESAVKSLQNHQRFVLETFIQGREVSLMVFLSDDSFFVCPPVQDHKRRFNNDSGPNTGGMGTVSPPQWWTQKHGDRIQRDIIEPSIRGIRKWQKATGQLYRGILFIGVMIEDSGRPWVLEYNVRLGDPETQPLVLKFEGDWGEVFSTLSKGQDIVPKFQNYFSNDTAVAVVVVNKEYPEKIPQERREISGLNASGQFAGDDEKAWVMHSGTRHDKGVWLAEGGRVLTVGARATSYPQVMSQLSKRIEKLSFTGMDFRTDIGRI